MNGLKSYDNMSSSDDEDLTPEQREKRRLKRLQIKMHLSSINISQKKYI